MSTKGGKSDGSRGKGEKKPGGERNMTFEEFLNICPPESMERDALLKLFNETKNNKEAIAALTARLWEDAPLHNDWEPVKKKEAEKPSKTNNSASDPKSYSKESSRGTEGKRDGAGVRPVSNGGGLSKEGGRREGAFNAKPKEERPNVSAPAASAPVATIAQPPVTTQPAVVAPAPSAATGTNNKSDSSMVRAGESFAHRLKRVEEEKKKQETKAAEDAAAAKEQKRKEEKASKKKVAPKVEDHVEVASPAVIAAPVLPIAESSTVAAAVVTQTEVAPVAKKEAKVEASIPQLEQTFSNISTADSVLSSIPAEAPSAIVNSQISSESELKQKSSGYTFGNFNSNSVAGTTYSSFASSGQTQGWATTDSVSFNNQVSDESLFKPAAIEVSNNGSTSNKPPGLKEPGQVSRDQRHGNKQDGQHAPLIMQQQTQAFNYNNQTFPQRYEPGYPMSTPYPIPPQQAPSSVLNSNINPAAPAGLASQQQAMPGFSGQPAQGQLQPPMPQQGNYGAYWPPHQNPYFYPPQYYGHYMAPNQYPYRSVPRGQSGSYDNQYQGGDYQAGYAGYNVDPTAVQPSQPSNKQGKANSSGAQVGNAQPQVDHSAGQSYMYPRGAPYGYDSGMQWNPQMYSQPNNQSQGMGSGMRTDGTGARGGGNAPMNHNPNFNSSYGGRGQNNNNQQNPNYNLGPYNA